jgi:phage-related protein
MARIGRLCHELRIQDVAVTWRLIYRVDADAVIILDLFAKKTQRTPDAVIRECQRRLARYDRAG